LPPEERSNVHLLYLLYACVFWRGEAEHLKISSSLKFFEAHRQKDGRWVFVFYFETRERILEPNI
jgi:hypothetical protein